MAFFLTLMPDSVIFHISQYISLIGQIWEELVPFSTAQVDGNLNVSLLCFHLKKKKVTIQQPPTG